MSLRVTAEMNQTSLVADGQDVALIRVEVLDSTGQVVPTASHNVTFTVDGPAEVIGVGNGDPQDLGSFTAARRSTFRGRALAVLRPVAAGVAGQVRLNATAPGLRPASLVVRIDPAACVV